MAIQFEKPQPLMVGDKAYYTLSSYDPVQVKVTVPLVTDADVTFALATLLAQMEATPEQLSDHEWFAQHFPVQHDNRIRAQHHRIGMLRRYGRRLGSGEFLYFFTQRLLRIQCLHNIRGFHSKSVGTFCQQFPPPG